MPRDTAMPWKVHGFFYFCTGKLIKINKVINKNMATMFLLQHVLLKMKMLFIYYYGLLALFKRQTCLTPGAAPPVSCRGAHVLQVATTSLLHHLERMLL
jgi:hypothetical protein